MEGVFPAIRKLYAGEDVVYVQQDGAPGHTGKKTPELLAEAGRKRKRGEPRIELVQQPAQSPDFNICDLAFFRALAVAVRKRRRSTMRGPKRFDIPTLVEDVETAFKEYPPEQLEKMWQHKSYVMGAVLTTKPKVGRSNYPCAMPQPREARAVEPPVEVVLVNTRYSAASVCAGMVSRVCVWALGVPKRRE